ncbi:MAG: Septum formation initiator [Firmicutes bacterium]|nr:Septum formation initiator [Bacillota bacterium]
MRSSRTYRIKWFRMATLVIVGYCFYILTSQQLEFNAVSRETEATKARLEQLKQANNSLAEEKERLSTPAYLEKIAREELGMVKPGEIPYIQTENK